MYTLHHCNIFSLKCPTTHWNRAPKFKSAFFTSSKLWKLSNGFVLRLYHISFNVNLASQATKPFPQSCGAKYFSQQSPFIFLAQKSLYLANTFLGPAPRRVAALVSVSDDKMDGFRGDPFKEEIWRQRMQVLPKTFQRLLSHVSHCLLVVLFSHV